MDRQEEKALGNIIGDYLNNSGLDNELDAMKVEQIWESLVGPLISKKTNSLHVNGNRLFVTIESAPIKSELQYEKLNLLEKLNRELGQEFIKEIIIR